MKNQKGITLITLTIIIFVLLILIVSISFNAPSLLNNRKQKEFENDIEILKEEIDQYYAKNKKLPVINKYLNTEMLEKNINDNENYYVIDLSKITITLNFGKEYEKIKNIDKQTDIKENHNILDIYIVNEKSHTIYYPKGIEYDDEIRYTVKEKFTQISNVNFLDIYLEQGIIAKENTVLKDELGNKFVLPEGFKIAEDSGLTVPEGIVIEDDDIMTDGNNKKRGNQYVWIPVGTIIMNDQSEQNIILGRYVFSDNGQENLRQNIEQYSDIINKENSYEENTTRIENNLNATALNLRGFKKSVKENGGYYIARYEATYGLDGKANSKLSNNFSVENEPVEEGTLWNFITQIDAAKASRNIYNDNNVVTDLINSYAWDTAISFIQKCSNTNYSHQKSKNHELSNTGNNNDEICKINDMASNALEWTTETYNFISDPCLYRGGTYLDENLYVESSGNTNVEQKAANQTFRTILYINEEDLLANNVRIGDYVNYNTIGEDEIDRTYTTDRNITGSDVIAEFKSSDIKKWRVWNINKDTSTVEIICDDIAQSILTLEGMTGYKNSKKVLNDIAEIYSYGKGAIKARNFNEKDLELYSNFNKTEYQTYGENKIYTSGTFITDEGEEKIASLENPVTVKNTDYDYDANEHINDRTVFDMLFRKVLPQNAYGILIDARYILCGEDFASQGIRQLRYDGNIKDKIWGTSSFRTNGEQPFIPSGCILPIVTLQSNLETVGQNNDGVWMIK